MEKQKQEIKVAEIMNKPLSHQIIDTGSKKYKRTFSKWQYDTLMNSYCGKVTINKRSYVVWKTKAETTTWGFIPHEQ
jgi:hypothetical protein